MRSRVERIEYLKSTMDAADKSSDGVRTKTIPSWRGKELVRKIVRVDSNYLMYRIENSRTIRQQLKYIRNHPDLINSFFSEAESSKTQQAQEEILLEMIKATGNDFIQDLKRRGQEDAAIVTYDGYIVNGNRRIAALRDIGEIYVDVIILPEYAKKTDIFELEQELQLSQDFKEPYHWINELKNISMALKVYLFTVEHEALRLRCSESDIRSKMRMFELVDSFLSWKGLDGQYDYEKLDDAEQVFIQLEKGTRSYSSNIPKRQQLEFAIFTIVDQGPSEGRAYATANLIIKNFNQIYESMAKKVNKKYSEPVTTEYEVKEIEDAVKPSTPIEQGHTPDILDTLIESETEVVDVFGDSTNVVELSENLLETVNVIKLTNKETKDAEAIYKAVSDALRDLQGIVISENTAKISSIKNKLLSIISTSNEILQQIKPYEKV